MRISDWSSDVCSSDLQFAAGPTVPAPAIVEEGQRSDGGARRDVQPGPNAEFVALIRVPVQQPVPHETLAVHRLGGRPQRHRFTQGLFSMDLIWRAFTLLHMNPTSPSISFVDLFGLLRPSPPVAFPHNRAP